MNSNDNLQWFKQDLLTGFEGDYFLPELHVHGGKTGAMVPKRDGSSIVAPPLTNSFTELAAELTTANTTEPVRTVNYSPKGETGNRT